MKLYEPKLGLHIDTVATESSKLAKAKKNPISFDFNGTTLTALPNESEDETRLKFRRALGLPDVKRPFHPQTAADALARWDGDETVFTVEMGGLGPGYEQAIQILVFELLRDNLKKPLPEPKSDAAKTWGDDTVHRIDSQCGGFSGAQAGAARSVAYRALRDGWENMLQSAPKDRHIQVSKKMPQLA